MKILKENLVKKDITIEQLKKLVNTIYNKLNSIPKPSEYKVGGTYYGSTELLSQRGNMLEIINNYRTPGDYYSISINYKNCYAVKIGGAYKYDLYKDELDELRKIFNYRVQSGWGIYDQIITSDGYKVRLINEPGTNFSVFGFDILDAANESLEEAKQKTALKSNGVYSVMNDTWIKEPVAEDIPEVDRKAFEKELKIWENKAKELLDSSKKELTESREEDLLKARSIIADQIRGEWDADRGYEKAVADLADLKDIDTKGAQDILLDIASEEHVHVGELETAYDAFDPKLFDKLEDGHNEADEKAEPANELDYDQNKIDASLEEAKHIDGKFDNRNIEYKRSPAGLGKRYKPALIKLFNNPDTRLEIQLFKELKINPVATLRDLLLDRLVLHHLNQDHFDYGSYNEFITSREMHDKLSRLPKVTDKRINNRTEYIEALKAGYEEAFKSGLVLFKLSDLLDAENGVVPPPIKTYEAIKHDLEDHIPEDWFDDWRDEAAMSNIAQENESLCESVESDQIEKIEDFMDRLYEMRKIAIANEGEYSIGNLVFKELRNKGYLDELREIKLILKSKYLSLTEDLKYTIETQFKQSSDPDVLRIIENGVQTNADATLKKF